MFTISLYNDDERVATVSYKTLARATAYFQTVCEGNEDDPEITVHLSYDGKIIATNGEFSAAWYDLTNEEQERV